MLYHAYAKSLENLDENLTNKMAANLQNGDIPNYCVSRCLLLMKRDMMQEVLQGSFIDCW